MLKGQFKCEWCGFGYWTLSLALVFGKLQMVCDTCADAAERRD